MSKDLQPEAKVAPTTSEGEVEQSHVIVYNIQHDGSRALQSRLGLNSEEHTTDFSISPQGEGKLLHDDSGVARQRRHKRKSSSKRHIEHHSERRSEAHRRTSQ
jgi:hypothetical protein